MLARIAVAPRPEQVETVAEPLEQLIGRVHRRPRGRELERERQSVEPIAEVAHGFGFDEPRVELTRALDEEVDAVAIVHRGDRIEVLSVNSEPLPARDDELWTADRVDRRDRIRNRRQQMLGIVEQQQQALPDKAGLVLELE